MRAIDVALQHLAEGVRETYGPNRSPLIDAMNRAVGVPVGSPYCASGVSWCFRQVWRTGNPRFPYTASTQRMRRLFQARNRYTRNPQDLLQMEGAIFGWTNADLIHGHVGFVEGRLTEPDGTVTGIRTIEYNTNLSGSREGEGIFRLVRRRGADGLWRVENAQRRLVGTGRRIWFCDTSDIAGGGWWNGR